MGQELIKNSARSLSESLRSTLVPVSRHISTCMSADDETLVVGFTRRPKELKAKDLWFGESGVKVHLVPRDVTRRDT